MDLSKNSESMKTVIETFVIEETAGLIYDGDKLNNWNDYVEKLGLIGQAKLVKPDKSPIPFMFMKESMVRIFQTLCPRTVSVEEYDVTPIPFEILELISLSKAEQYFQEIQIWYDDSDPDPACVGMTCKYYGYGNSRTPYFDTKQEVYEYMNDKDGSVYTADVKYYLLGKWADVRRNFEELKQMAIDRYIATQTVGLQQSIKRYTTELAELEMTAKQYFQ